jgi:colanic acid/amylovoran biosynthesis glycosyltransferase
MPFGSGEAFFIPEVKEILWRGHQVLIVPRSPKGGVTNRDADGLQTISARPSWGMLEIGAAAVAEFFFHPRLSCRALRWIFKSRNLSTLLKNLFVFPKALWVGRLARRWSADHIHAQWALTTSTMALVASVTSGIPWSCTAHRHDIVSDNLLALKYQHASFFRFIGRKGIELAESRGVACNGKKACIIHMGVRVPPVEQLQSPAEDASQLLCVANLKPVKGHRYLLEAVRILKQQGVDCRLDVAGDGLILAELQALAESLAISDRTRFLGAVPHDRVLERYRRGEIGIFVLPSIDLGGGHHEGIPVSLMEAMAHRIPVVSTNTGGIPELLHDGGGVLVPPNDPVAMAEAIRSVLQDGDLRKELASAGRRRIEEEFSIEDVMTRVLARIEDEFSRDRTHTVDSESSFHVTTTG